MSLLLAFTQLDFTHAIGPAAGAYVVAPGVGGVGPASADRTGAISPISAALTGMERDVASADVLLVAVEGHGVSGRRGSRRSRGTSSEQREVPITVATHVRATTPLAGHDAARARLIAFDEDREAQDREIDDALKIINLAIRAHRIASGDPYIVEITREDAQAIRLGYGEGADVRRGRWEDAVEVPVAGSGGGGRPSDAQEFVAHVLAGGPPPLASEDLLLRALLDRAHGQTRSAALQVHAAFALLQAEAFEQNHELAEVTARDADAGQLRDRALLGELQGASRELLDALIGVLERGLKTLRTERDANHV